MQVDGLGWPPRPEEYYLDSDEHRPVAQGDVFADVPFAKNRRASKQSDDPNTIHERRLVAVTGYTCDLYNTQTGELGKVQIVAPVIEASAGGIPDDWAGAFNFVPLPDLLGDGRMHAVDLRAASNTGEVLADLERELDRPPPAPGTKGSVAKKAAVPKSGTREAAPGKRTTRS